MTERAPAAVTSPSIALLACTACRGELRDEGERVTCVTCERSWPRDPSGVVDFRETAGSGTEGAAGLWQRRQDEMERWYEDLITREREAVGCFLNDYSAIAPTLARLSGRVLDVGGGIGVTRQYLRNGVDYVNLDPSGEWLDPAWRGLIPDFPVLAEPMSFVRGTGERLPFRPESFDAVLSLWSLNHASSPQLVIRECRGVLRPGGTLFLVMEDMEPTWGDIARGAARSRRAVGRKALNALLRRRWPVQPDHIRIDEEELLRWSSEGFSLARREWVGNGLGYLTFELTRL